MDPRECPECGRDEYTDCRCGDDGGPDDSDECYWCGGEGWTECNDPIECTQPHRNYRLSGLYRECPCGSCGGTGLAKDMTIW